MLLLRFLKFGTVLSYLFITFRGEHMGGPLGLFLILGLFNSGIPEQLIILLALASICFLCFSAIRPNINRDKYLIPLAAIFMVIPISQDAFNYIKYSRWSFQNPFAFTCTLFLILISITLIIVFRTRDTSAA